MSLYFTQPEEIDLVPREVSKSAAGASLETSDNKPSAKSAQERWNTGSMSPYRAAYMKAHGLVS